MANGKSYLNLLYTFLRNRVWHLNQIHLNKNPENLLNIQEFFYRYKYEYLIYNNLKKNERLTMYNNDHAQQKLVTPHIRSVEHKTLIFS